jgi:hypothetical protein
MTPAPTTSGIDLLAAEPTAAGWRIRFRSDHAGLRHQLYVNGRLADWTDAADQRSFLLPPSAAAVAVVVAAVPPSRRRDDLAAELDSPPVEPSWVVRRRILRDVAASKNETVELLTDHASGQLDPTPLASAPLWPAWMPRFGFGRGRFGEGGFGHDGGQAPGLGVGAFGAGPFGLGSPPLELTADLAEPGTHQLTLRRRRGHATAELTWSREVHPPPQPATSLAAVAYDPQTQHLTLQIN